MCCINMLVKIALFVESFITSFEITFYRSFLSVSNQMFKKTIFAIKLAFANFIWLNLILALENHSLGTFFLTFFDKVHYEIFRFWQIRLFKFELFCIKILAINNANFKSWLYFMFFDEFMAQNSFALLKL